MKEYTLAAFLAVSLAVLFVQPSEPLTAPLNLLQNVGAEDGAAAPDVWRSLALSPADVAFNWEETVVNSGRRSLGIELSKPSIGMWQQTVPVVPGQLYLLTGNVAFQDVTVPESCRLQIVFRDAAGVFLNFTDLPGHNGTRWFSFDFPAKLKVRAPQNAAFAEINCILASTGRAWFDDLFFGPAPAGRIVGTVSSAGTPLPWAHVFIWGDPWGKKMEAVTGPDGSYAIEDVPVAFPRYILLAEAQGHRTQVQGRIQISENDSVQVDFDLPVGSNPKDDLRVKFGTIGAMTFVRPPTVPDDAVIPDNASGYPALIIPYLEDDEYIESEHPDIKRLANAILESLAQENQRSTRAVALAIHTWVAKNIEHDGVFLNPTKGELKQPYKDVTSGIWQTISDDGWCFGKNIYDWAYHPSELLQIKSGICIEHAWLISALLRAVNIPARASFGSLEFWAQDESMNGAWIGISPTGGRSSYRQEGTLGSGFEISGTEQFSVAPHPILQEDWDGQREGLWRETHPWTVDYEWTAAGYARAVADLITFKKNGKAVSYKTEQPFGVNPPEKSYKIYYSDVTINLYNMTEQRFLDVRFPLVTGTEQHVSTGDNIYWTNHPECVLATWIENISNPPIEETEQWFHVLFDISSVIK